MGGVTRPLLLSAFFFFFLFQQITILLFRRSFSMLLARTLLCFFFFFCVSHFFFDATSNTDGVSFFFFPHFLLSLSPSKKKKKGDIRQVATKLSKLVESVLRHIYLETRRELELQVTHLTKEERKKKKTEGPFWVLFQGFGSWNKLSTPASQTREPSTQSSASLLSSLSQTMVESFPAATRTCDKALRWRTSSLPTYTQAHTYRREKLPRSVGKQLFSLFSRWASSVLSLRRCRWIRA